MTKVADKVRFRPLKSTAHRAKAIVEYTNTNPGADAFAISRAIGAPIDTTYASTAWLVKTKRIKMVRLDGRNRYYPYNYEVAGEVVSRFECDKCGKGFVTRQQMIGHKAGAHTAHPARKTRKAAPPPADIFSTDPVEIAVKRFYWEAGSELTLQNFVHWYKGVRK